ncbi:Uncharacterised protein [Mycobacterium tuberculosis]|nr:Uncharacterised protein [Mycobacterium tuberculosis]COV21265.1 Uncharacterised protein [Mycobacterium tuberculosis]
MVALEHIEHNLKIGQGLWQRIANTAEYRVNLIGGGGRLGQDASHVLIPGRGLCGQIVQFARPALDLITRVDLAVQNRPGVLDDVVDVANVGFEVTDDRLSGIDQPLQRGSQPTHRLRGLVEQQADLLRGQCGQPAIGIVQRRPDLTGNGALGDGLSGGEVFTRSTGGHQVDVLLAHR